LSIELPTGAIREYLIAFGVDAIYVGVLPDGDVCKIGVTRDLMRSYQAMRVRWPGSTIAAAFWLSGRGEAERIARIVRDKLPRDELAAIVEIELAAVQAQIRLTDHTAAMGRVIAALGRVDAELARAHQAGQLGWFNRGFKRWRLAHAGRQGDRCMNFTEAKARLRRAVVRRLIAGGYVAGQAMASLEGEIFPVLGE
jgi:hypothetical protein